MLPPLISRQTPALSTLALNAFIKTADNNSPNISTFCSAFAKINQGSNQQVHALDVLKTFPLGKIAYLPLFDEACDEYTQLVLTSKEKLDSLTQVEMAAMPLFEGASENYTQRVLSSIDAVFQTSSSGTSNENRIAKGKAFLNLIQSCQNEKLPAATREALTQLKLSLNEKKAFTSHCLNGLNFSGLDLSKLNLSKTFMDDTNFSNANLHGVTLYGKNMRNVNFTGADLSDVTVTWGGIFNSDLSNTNLTNTTFFKTQLEGNIFTSAYLSNTQFLCVTSDVDLSQAYVKEDHPDQELLKIYQEKESEALSTYTTTSKNKKVTQPGVDKSVSSDKRDKSENCSVM